MIKIKSDSGILLILCRLYFFLLPFFILPTPHIFFNKIRYADLLFLFIFLFWTHGIFTKKYRLPDFKIILILAIFLLVNFFSFIYSLDRSMSVLDFLGACYLVVLFIVFASLFKEELFIENTINTLAFAAGTVSIIGLIAFMLYYLKVLNLDFGLVSFYGFKSQVAPFARICSVCGTSEMFITFVQLGFACFLFKLFSKSEKTRNNLAFVIGVTIILIALILAWSRALAGIFFMLSFILIKLNSRRLAFWRNLAIFAFLFFFIGALVTSVWMVYPVKFKNDVTSEEFSIVINTAPDLRSINRHAAIKMFKDRPFFGIGQGMFTYKIKDYLDKENFDKTFTLNQFELDSFQADPHSTFFGALAETGILGLMAMLLLIFYTIYDNKLILTSEGSNFRLYFFACFLGYLFTALFSDVFAFRHLWLTMAVLTGSKTQNTKSYAK